MSPIKSFIGTLAVLFSIQSAVTWAANESKEKGKETKASDARDRIKEDKSISREKNVISIESREKARVQGNGLPTCGGGL